MKRFLFDLNLSSREYLHYYRGSISMVLVRCTDGTTVQFPAGLLRPFVTSGGVRGAFVLTCDDQGKGSQLSRR